MGDWADEQIDKDMMREVQIDLHSVGKCEGPDSCRYCNQEINVEVDKL